MNPEILIEINKEDPSAYRITFKNHVHIGNLTAVLVSLLERIHDGEFSPGQKENPELTITPTFGGPDDILN